MSRKHAALLYIVTAIVILAADLWSKEVVFEMLGCTIEYGAEGVPYTQRSEIHLIDGWFSFEASINTGAFSGWFSEHTGVLAAVSILAVAFISALALVPAHSPKLMVLALGLLAGGALGNFYDRHFLKGVRDFLKVYRGDWVWPNFNIADSAICVGVGLIVLREVFGWGGGKQPAAVSPEAVSPEPEARSLETAADPRTHTSTASSQRTSVDPAAGAVDAKAATAEE